MHEPEVWLSCLLAVAGVSAALLYELALSAFLLLLLALASYLVLRPPVHVMKGYGTLRGGTPAPICPPQGAVLIDRHAFKDEHGRTLLLRGVNLSGSSKLPSHPASAASTSIPAQGSTFYDHRNVSFVGRPFPLDQADEHFARLRLWGLTFLRLLVTWEAIEHRGPGMYDKEYMRYLLAIVRKAAAHGISVFIDPHMDTWSRYCGGDGAPGWTLEAAGFKLSAIHASGAASLHQEEGSIATMAWPTNNLKLAAATMYTLFFAGDDFAPKLQVKGEPIQRYLQRHYIGSLQQLAELLKAEPNVVGFDSLNEPSVGYVGRADLRSTDGLKNGTFVTGWEGMKLGAGFSVEATRYSPIFVPRGKVRLNPTGTRAWADGVQCVWEAHGVYALPPKGSAAEPSLLVPDYFSKKPDGTPVHFASDYMVPLWEKVLAMLDTVKRGNVHPYLLFAELHLDLNSVDAAKMPYELVEAANSLSEERRKALFGRQRVCVAPHWYDGLTLVLKTFRPWWTVDLMSSIPVLGSAASQRAVNRYLGQLVRQGKALPEGGAPVLIGETGVPFDLCGAKPTADMRVQILALERTMRALESALVSFTLWNYTPDNTREDGDHWNGEDLSVFSEYMRDSRDDLHSGGRALPALVRPYARKVSGTPLQMSFSAQDKKRAFKFVFCHEDGILLPTEIFVPHYQYPDGVQVSVSDGEWSLDERHQTLYYMHTSTRKEHTISLSLP